MSQLSHCPQCQHRLIRRPGAERLSCSLCDWVEVGAVAPATPEPPPIPPASGVSSGTLKPSYIIMGVIALAVLAFLLGRSCQPSAPSEEPLTSPSPETALPFSPEPTPLVTPTPEPSPEVSESPTPEASPSAEPSGSPDPEAAVNAVESAVAALEGGAPEPVASSSPSADNGTMLVQPPDIPPPVATDPPVETAP
jgi:hypothetical protein